MFKRIVMCIAVLIVSATRIQATEVKEKVEFELKVGITDFSYGDMSSVNEYRFEDPAGSFGVHYWLNNRFAVGGELNWSKSSIGDLAGNSAVTDLNSLSLLFKYRFFESSNSSFTFNAGAGFLFYEVNVMPGNPKIVNVTGGKYNEFVLPFGVAYNYSFSDKITFNLFAQNYTTIEDRIDGLIQENDDLLDKPEGYINIGAGISMFLETNSDKDNDGIENAKDKCPEIAEDKDGFEDKDGCPELDNDNDGIADIKDKCPNLAEDKDGFKDDDGCPDLDNDNDKISDSSDKCPLIVEDYDGFEDEDGCPDLDNDQDGVADISDKCPLVAEDPDGFEDEDGCPDLDNDQDGIPDVSDKCPNQPETVNNYKDDDGCPDVILKKNDKITLNNIYFKSGKSEILAESYIELEKIQALFADNPNLVIQIEGHTDNQGSAVVNKQLSAKRAESIKRFIIDKFGIAPGRLFAVGFGSEKPIANNATVEGRSQNRRIEFKIIKN